MPCRESVNADLIAAGLAPFAPDRAAFEAGRIMLRRLRELASRRKNFAFETTLSGRSYAPLLRDLRAAGYFIQLDFLWIPDLDITRNRVRQRVTKGGHNIPDEVQRRRFHLGIRNLAELYRPPVNCWRLYDHTGTNPHLVAEEKAGVLTVIDAPSSNGARAAAASKFPPSNSNPLPAVSSKGTATRFRPTKKAPCSSTSRSECSPDFAGTARLDRCVPLPAA